MKTEYKGSIVAFIECERHEFGHTVVLDGEHAWIKDEALFIKHNDGDVTNPDKWNFVHHFNRQAGRMELNELYVGVIEGGLVLKTTYLPTLHWNVIARKIDCSFSLAQANELTDILSDDLSGGPIVNEMYDIVTSAISKVR
jgi:hypothetical protein